MTSYVVRVRDLCPRTGRVGEKRVALVTYNPAQAERVLIELITTQAVEAWIESRRN